MAKLIIGAILLIKALSSFTPAPDYANEGFIGFGIGARGMKFFDTAIMIVNVGYKHKTSDYTYIQYKCGYFDTNKSSHKYKNRFFVFVGPGLEADLRSVETYGYIGVGAILSAESKLNLEFPYFNEEFYVGVKNETGDSVGIGREHMSNAEIKKPNYGRDFWITRFCRKW